MTRKIFTSIVLVAMLGVGGIKVFTRVLLLEGEAGAACIVATYKPALNKFLYIRGNEKVYEAEYGEIVVLEERTGYVDPKQPIRFHILGLAYFQDGSYGYPIYQWMFIRHFWRIEGYLLPFFLMGIFLMISEKYRQRRTESKDALVWHKGALTEHWC